MKFQTIPFKNRQSVYSIKNIESLWIKPTYIQGEIWSFYGSIFDEEHTIIKKIKNTNQVLTKSNGKYFLFDLDRWGYASSGTPSLRMRIK